MHHICLLINTQLLILQQTITVTGESYLHDRISFCESFVCLVINSLNFKYYGI